MLALVSSTLSICNCKLTPPHSLHHRRKTLQYRGDTKKEPRSLHTRSRRFNPNWRHRTLHTIIETSTSLRRRRGCMALLKRYYLEASSQADAIALSTTPLRKLGRHGEVEHLPSLLGNAFSTLNHELTPPHSLRYRPEGYNIKEMRRSKLAAYEHVLDVSIQVEAPAGSVLSFRCGQCGGGAG